ncbi:hypothetical protein PTT_07014 [Pyrenophora teres f. teres 0-1]|uniref:Uncharacterized protein n=1 Tax=Pyrenophora teres f. teres (strain 0-1) TaxID=861557 RepID=E3RGR3_PYRTT|nr:hypothetical protein PTT_07014 [Pyrenophora teres f. teres 0-1]
MASPMVEVLVGPDASKAFRQLASVNTSKNASLKAGRKPCSLMWKTRRHAKSLTRWEYLRFNGGKQTTSSG